MKRYIHRDADDRTVGEALSDGHALTYITGEEPDIGAAAWHMEIAEAPYDFIDIYDAADSHTRMVSAL